MQEALKESSPTPESPAPVGHCKDAQRRDLPLRALQQALYACFAELGNRLSFGDALVTRVEALALLTSLPEPERRRAVFMAFEPLWQALNGNDEPDSPYRRMMALAAARARSSPSPVERAARTLGVTSEETERWLEQLLDTWRQVSGESEVEPWDYRFQADAGVRSLNELIPGDGMQALNQRYYADLGLDLASEHVIYDLEPRRGKAPLAYTDFVLRGRQRADLWRPTIVRVSGSYSHGSLGELNELVHENGHAAHMLALRTRPAFMDLGDPIFYEAFADVSSWSVYEPAWQRKYLGHSARETDSLHALYGSVMLDVAWALFDARMLRHPDADPNQLWTDITQRYLHVRAHPEFSWWAMRVQLVDVPGYMVNYGLGSVITAELRQRIAQELRAATRAGLPGSASTCSPRASSTPRASCWKAFSVAPCRPTRFSRSCAGCRRQAATRSRTHPRQDFFSPTMTSTQPAPSSTPPTQPGTARFSCTFASISPSLNTCSSCG
jgi:hypothetical protein